MTWRVIRELRHGADIRNRNKAKGRRVRWREGVRPTVSVSWRPVCWRNSLALFTEQLVDRWLNRSFAEPPVSTFWENWAVATMAITRGKCVVSHNNQIGPILCRAWADLSVVSFPVKRHELPDSGYRTTRFWVRFYATETNRDLHRSSQRWKIDNHTSHVVFLQYCVGTCKNNTSPKITFAYNSGCENFRELQLCQKLKILINYSWGEINQVLNIVLACFLRFSWKRVVYTCVAFANDRFSCSCKSSVCTLCTNWTYSGEGVSVFTCFISKTFLWFLFNLALRVKTGVGPYLFCVCVCARVRARSHVCVSEWENVAQNSD